MADRSYNDPCGVARALDRVGERWSLLIVRELLLGPKRYSDLARGLDGVSPNVLAHRLKELEAAGVVERADTLPPASGQAYRLTEWGHELDSVVIALATWGSQAPLASEHDLSPDAFVISLRTTFDPSRAPELSARIALHIDGDRFDLTIDRGTITVARGDAAKPDLVLRGTTAALRAVVYGGLDLGRARSDGQLHINGTITLARTVIACFPRPRARIPPTMPHD
jgi:DNA-binding HxlR family transcriptional regulator/putative sterol carrier protein